MITPKSAILLSFCLLLPYTAYGEEPPDCASNPLLTSANTKIEACVQLTDADAALSCAAELEAGMGANEQVLVPLMLACQEEVGRVVKTVQALNFYHGSLKKIEELGSRIEKAIPFFEEKGRFPGAEEEGLAGDELPSLTQEWLKLTQAVKQVSNITQLGAPQVSFLEEEHSKYQKYFDVAKWIKDSAIDYDGLSKEDRGKIIAEGKLGADGAQVARDNRRLRKDAHVVRQSLSEVKGMLGKGPLDAEQSKKLAKLFENARAAGGDSFDAAFSQYAGKDLMAYSRLSAAEIAKNENARALALQPGLKADTVIPAPDAAAKQPEGRDAWAMKIDQFILRAFPDKENDIPPAHHAYLRSLVPPLHKGQPPGTLVFLAHQEETKRFVQENGRTPNDAEALAIYSRIFGEPDSDLDRLTERAIKKRYIEQEEEMTDISANVVGMIPFVGLAEYLIRPPETNEDYGWMGGQMALSAFGLGIVGKTVKGASKIPVPPGQLSKWASSAAGWAKGLFKSAPEAAEAGARLTRAPQPVLNGALRLPTAALQNTASGMGRIVGALPFTNGFIKSYGKGSVILERINNETVRRHFISPLIDRASYGDDVRQGMTQLIGDLKSLQAKGYKYVESISFHQGALGTALKHGFKEVDDVVLTAREMKKMRANFALIEKSNLLPKGAEIFIGESGLYKPVITRLDIAAKLAELGM